MLPAPLLYLLVLFAIPFAAIAPRAAESGAISQEPDTYHLSLAFDLPSATLYGTARIEIGPGSPLDLDLGGLNITGNLLRLADGREKQLSISSEHLTIPPASSPRSLYLSWEKTVSHGMDNLVSEEGIVLLHRWYPVPTRRHLFRLEARLPEKTKGSIPFTAITESDRFPLPAVPHNPHLVHSSWSRPTTTINFVAGPYHHRSRRVRDGLTVHTLFFSNDAELATSYLDRAAETLSRYEKEIGPYPWSHFVVVANRLPTGYGMPGFTLLGERILPLPFIREFSLGHEILHSWFGNDVEVDNRGGNWCEGLTSYLADHAFRADRGEGIQDRRETISRYLSYVQGQGVIPLTDFVSSSHHQVNAELQRSVGYDRGAMLFHELRTLLGDETFFRAIRQFYREHRHGKASWQDIVQSFESSSGKSLNLFFSQRLERTDIPSISASDFSVQSTEDGFLLRFQLNQNSEEPFSLTIPIRITTGTGEYRMRQTISGKTTDVEKLLDSRPLQIILDPEYSMLRQLDRREFPASWSRFRGSPEKLVVLPDGDDRKRYSSLLKLPELKQLDSAHLVTASEVKNSHLADHDLLLLGRHQKITASLFAHGTTAPEGFLLESRRNPLNPDRVAIIIDSSSAEESDAVSRRLQYYGKYSRLRFLRGRNLEKSISKTDSGIIYELETLPEGGRASELSNFDKLIEELANHSVIYLGEGHTSTGDHSLQLRCIEGLARRLPKLVLAMEMFPAAANESLRRYTVERRSSEKQFLQESRYFSVWRFDYRYYRGILNFARSREIPVFGLNLDRSIVSRVFQTGSTDALSPEVLAGLVQERDLDLPGYVERLELTHQAHTGGGHGRGSFSGFIQAQALWDETMARNLLHILEQDPETTIVVLAGNEHTRKDSGIPPRVARQRSVAQAVVRNLATGQVPVDIGRLADYYFFETAPDLPPSGRIGIVLEESDTGLTISELSPHGEAGKAGLRKGDRLVALDGYTVTTLEDLRIGMVDARPGQRMDLTVLRAGNPDRKETISVTLTAPPAGPAHP